MSFDPNTVERRAVVDVFHSKSWARMALKGAHDEDFVELLGQSEFVVCPPGNGLDTHRLWEALACGTIPVLRRGSLHPRTLGKGVVWVDAWTDVVSLEWLRARAGDVASERAHMMATHLERLQMLTAIG